MKNKCKKILTAVLAATLTFSALSLASCGDAYENPALEGYTTPTAAAKDNGGFSVEYGDYVYFINGQEAYTASNEFGAVTKGSLMRIKKADLDRAISTENYNSAEVVVPMLFVAQNFESGIYIYGDYVYYATPTTDKNMSGTVENTWIDFKRAKLDGSETMKDYYFRLSDNASKYRFVEAGEGDAKAVYCLYEEEGSLKSYNTETGATTVLVSNAKTAEGASVSYFYDKNDLTNPNVYYIMSVAPDKEAPTPLPEEKYDQVYCVNAAATVEKVEKGEDTVSYTVKGGATYSFNREYMEIANDKAEKDDDKTTVAPYDFDDYTTFPYVNLGSLVMDGIGASNTKTQFNEQKTATAATFNGYNYAIQSVQNGGVYFTRTEVMQTETAAENTSLYYLADKTGEWNAITANTAAVEIAPDTTKTGSAYFYIENGAHAYMYIEGTNLYRVKGMADAVRMTNKLPASSTIWKRIGDYVYTTAAASDGTGNAISRIKYAESDDVYAFLPEKAYQLETISYLNYNASWYMPEVYGDTVLYSNVKTFGSGSGYNYIYAAKLSNVTEQNEEYKKVQDYIAEYSMNADLQSLMKYYFRTGETAAYTSVEKLYDQYQKDEFKKFTENTSFKKESDFVAFVGKMTEEDATAISDSWVDYLRKETVSETEETESLPTWAIVLIVVGSVLVVAAAVLVPVCVTLSKKKAAKREAEATVNAYKRKKIDTTDDKSIDVYADEETAEETTQTAEETVREEPVSQAEESVEEPAETAETNE